MVVDPHVVLAEKLAAPLALKGHKVALVALVEVTTFSYLLFKHCIFVVKLYYYLVFD